MHTCINLTHHLFSRNIKLGKKYFCQELVKFDFNQENSNSYFSCKNKVVILFRIQSL